MNKTYDWMNVDDAHCSYYFNCETGKIMGQVNRIAHTKVWVSKIFNENQEKFLGQYISSDFAKQSISLYWEIEERTLIEDKRGH